MPFRRHSGCRRFATAAALALVLGGLGAFVPLAAGPARAESLAEALAAAYENNPTLRAARAQLRATNERVPQELANWRPQVTIDSSVGRQSIEDEDEFVTTEESTTPKRATLRVQQPVYRGGQTTAGVDRAEFEVQSERNRLDTTEQDVLERAVEAYMNVWRDREVLRLNTENVKALQEQLNATQERFERGVVTQTDVAQARSRVARAKARRETTRGELTNSRAVFEEVVGRPPGDLSYPDDMTQMPANVEAAVEMAAADNPEVMAARFASRAADRAVRQRTGQLLPSVTLQGELERQEETFRASDETSRAEIRMNVQIPLYQAGQVTSQVRQAKQTASQRRLQVAEAERRVRQEARSAWGRLEAARNQIDQRRTQLESARTAVRGMEEELNVGSRTVIDLLDAEQDLFNAQIAFVRAQRDLAVARFGVAAAVGALTAREMALDVELYDAEADYDEVRDTWWGLTAPNSDAGRQARVGDDRADRPQGSARNGEPEPTAAESDQAEAAPEPDADPRRATAEPAEPETGATGPAADGGDEAGDTQAGDTRAGAAQAGDTQAGDTRAGATQEAATPDAGTADTGTTGAGSAGGEPLPAGNQVEAIERLLAELDFTTGPIDGQLDPQTRAAIGQFQYTAGIPVTYEPSQQVLEELRAVAGQ